MTVVRQTPWEIRMKNCTFRLTGIGVAILLGGISTVCAQNQTPDVSPILPQDSLPFRISIEQADFSLPSGVQSYVAGTFGGRWLILAGRINGLHGFNNDNSNFPPNQQNSTVFVVDPVQKTVATRSLTAPGSGLTQSQVDLLSVTSAQSDVDPDARGGARTFDPDAFAVEIAGAGAVCWRTRLGAASYEQHENQFQAIVLRRRE